MWNTKTFSMIKKSGVIVENDDTLMSNEIKKNIKNDKKNIEIKINNIFKMIGAAAATANLLWEFNIAEKKDAKLTKNKNGIENVKNQMLTNKATALIFWDSSLVNPKGKLLVSINNLILMSNIIIPPIYPKAKPKPEDLPRFLLVVTTVAMVDKKLHALCLYW